MKVEVGVPKILHDLCGRGVALQKRWFWAVNHSDFSANQNVTINVPGENPKDWLQRFLNSEVLRSDVLFKVLLSF